MYLTGCCRMISPRSRNPPMSSRFLRLPAVLRLPSPECGWYHNILPAPAPWEASDWFGILLLIFFFFKSSNMTSLNFVLPLIHPSVYFLFRFHVFWYLLYHYNSIFHTNFLSFIPISYHILYNLYIIRSFYLYYIAFSYKYIYYFWYKSARKHMKGRYNVQGILKSKR